MRISREFVKSGCKWNWYGEAFCLCHKIIIEGRKVWKGRQTESAPDSKWRVDWRLGRRERTPSGRSSSNLFGVKSKGACVIRLFTCEWFLQAKFLANKMTAKRNETQRRNDETSELNISKRSKSGSSAERGEERGGGSQRRLRLASQGNCGAAGGAIYWFVAVVDWGCRRAVSRTVSLSFY